LRDDSVKSDIEIAQSIQLKPIREIARGVQLTEDDLIPHGHHIAKVPLSIMSRLDDRPEGKLILVTAMTPPAKGAGKTTTTIGLGQALARIGQSAMIAIREPSLGPCMGMKGGAAGGGYAQVLPMEDINLHFTGDLHAVTMAHNLCAAVVDNHLHHGGKPEIHPRRVGFRRVIDMNDRSLRHTIVGLLDQGINGVMREDGFQITAASEVMAILCLADSLTDLKKRIGDIIVGYDSLRRPVTAAEVGVQGAMTALLKNAINPNLVQTTEATPAFVHGGPFANIAHGCNTLVATRLGLRLADYVVTEAGFGADLGAEKFFHIKCRAGNLRPSAAVIVVPKRGYDTHGLENVLRHVEIIRSFHVPPVVSINKFADDRVEELEDIRQACEDAGVDAVITDYREGGGEGGLELAERIVEISSQDEPKLEFLYPLDMPIAEKVETVARRVYGAAGVEFSSAAKRQIRRIENLGYRNLPVCMAKTPMSLTDNPKVAGCPKDFTITVSDARASAGAGFVVISTGAIMTMPGLPEKPAALAIDVDDDGMISGLF
jgi:formate--tetrahydrofolate ligase